ncbi:hypothetical protein [Nakamurella lactea]|uniref:hypothetical protein n=1 Tax=Nakamurella lactea TaxID=459515 RepID=UPI00048DED7D|nr:hypothetical protein [Nakamurella lactea]
MKPPVSLGYLRPREGVIRALSWLVSDGSGDTSDLPESMPNWDYQQPVHLVSIVEANLAAVLADSDLPATAAIRAHMQWHATGTGLRGAGAAVDLEDGSTTIDLRLPGDLLGGTLNLEIRVVLGSLGGPAVSPYSAQRPGAILWTTGRRTHLEGVGTRFPVTQLSFANTGIAGGRGAAWCLHLESADLVDSAAGSLRLFVNTDQEQVREYMRQHESPAAVQFTRNLRFAVQRHLLAIACEHDELDIAADYEAGSLGEFLAALVRQLFPGRDLYSLQSDLRRNPGEFEAELQALTGYVP